MTVTEYKREFVRLSKYTQEMVATEVEKCRRFEDGLNNYIRVHLAALKMKNINRLVAAALDVERVEKDEQVRKDRSQQRRGFGQSSAYQPSSKRFRGPQTSGQTSQQRQMQGVRVRSEQPAASVANTLESTARGPAPAPCVYCETNYPGECW
ncbi:hypothetical protein ACOSQ3_021406 [Xanthoceras sorbifolium]